MAGKLEHNMTYGRRSTRCCIAVGAGASIAGIIIGILIGQFALNTNEPRKEQSCFENLVHEANPSISDLLMDTIDKGIMEENLRRLTLKPHIAGSPENEELATFLKDKLSSYGLDSVKTTPYDVLLSYPDDRNPNSVQLLDSGNDVIFNSLDAGSNISNNPGVVAPFLAYSPAKEVTADLIYVNYARPEDFDFLKKRNISVAGKIVIARYGRLYRGSKVKLAALHGAVGVVLYSDPRDYTWPQEDSRVFPDTIWLPPTAVQRGSMLQEIGDPLTPGYPATASAFRLRVEDLTSMSAIPAQALGYGAARHFMQDLQGDDAPEDWQGGLNFTYKFGPLMGGHKVKLSVHNSNSIRRIYNVIGIIRGAVEPDRYVLLGNHRDAWVYGAVDPSGGTAVMMEVARVMASLVTQGKWRPRRSVMFCSWGAEEYGLIGSNEWVEQYVKSIGARAVAYINIENAVRGNHSLRALGTPLLYRTLFDAARKVPNPNPAEVTAGRTTIYDTWKQTFPWKDYDLPRVASPPTASDFAPLLQIAGITSLDIRYNYDKNKYKIGGFPLYHTEYETFDAVKRLIDRNFEYHRSVARMGAEMLRSLSDSLIIPFNVSDYAWALELNRQQLDRDYGSVMAQRVDNYTSLENAIAGFKDDVKTFEHAASNVNKKNPMAVRLVNDQLLQLEKAFLDTEGLPDRPRKKHLLFAGNSNDVYAGSSFPGLVDLMFGIQDLQEPELGRRWEKVRHHFSVIVNAIQSAGFTLRDVINFVEEKY